MELFRDLYEAELARREKLAGAVALPVGVVTALGSVLLFMFREMPLPLNGWRYGFLVFGALCALALLVSTGYLARSYLGPLDARGSAYIPTANELLDWLKRLESYFDEYGDGDQPVGDRARAHLLIELESSWARAATYNTLQNDRRSEFLFRANIALVLALALLAGAAVPFGIDHLTVSLGDIDERQAESSAATTAAPSE